VTPRNSLLPLSLALILAACGSGGAVKTTSAPAKTSKAVPIRPAVRPAPIAPPKPRILTAPGLEGVIGAGPDDLVRQFGPARLDVWEGDARKLQFSGRACVLDVFLYPAEAGRPISATYVEARRSSDGQEVDRAACIAALRAR